MRRTVLRVRSLLAVDGRRAAADGPRGCLWAPTLHQATGDCRRLRLPLVIRVTVPARAAVTSPAGLIRAAACLGRRGLMRVPYGRIVGGGMPAHAQRGVSRHQVSGSIALNYPAHSVDPDAPDGCNQSRRESGDGTTRARPAPATVRLTAPSRAGDAPRMHTHVCPAEWGPGTAGAAGGVCRRRRRLPRAAGASSPRGCRRARQAGAPARPPRARVRVGVGGRRPVEAASPARGRVRRATGGRGAHGGWGASASLHGSVCRLAGGQRAELVVAAAGAARRGGAVPSSWRPTRLPAASPAQTDLAAWPFVPPATPARPPAAVRGRRAGVVSLWPPPSLRPPPPGGAAYRARGCARVAVGTAARVPASAGGGRAALLCRHTAAATRWT